MFVWGQGKKQYFRFWEYSSNRDRQGPFSQRVCMMNEKMKRTKIKTEPRLARSVMGVMSGYAMQEKLGDLVSSIDLLFVYEKTQTFSGPWLTSKLNILN